MTTQENAPARWHLISLRPRGGHAALRAAARRHGARLVAASPWHLQPETNAAARQALATALTAPVVIFSSPAAVIAAAQLLPLQRPAAACWLSVGAGTATQLQRYGVDQVQVPTRMDTEGLLALPALTQQLPRTIGLVTAPEGRSTLTQTLTARGAHILRADVYRRRPVALNAATLARLRAIADHGVLVISSGQALLHVLPQLPAELAATWRRQPAVVASARLLQLAQIQGFGQLQQAAGPMPEQLVAAAAAMMTARTHY